MDTLTKINVKVTAKAKALSCWIFENVPNKNCSLLTTKKTKSRQQNKPENPARKKTGKGKIKRAKRQKGGEEKKSSGCTPSFYFDFSGVFERKRLFEGRGLLWL